MFFISLLVSSTLSRNKKINLKSLNEKGQELGMLKETNLLTTSSILRSVRYTVSGLICQSV